MFSKVFLKKIGSYKISKKLIYSGSDNKLKERKKF